MSQNTVSMPKQAAAAFIVAQLVELHPCKEAFAVEFSGKKSKKVNGTYRVFNKTITINEKNFMNEDGELNESALMYTAIHELAHHIQYTEHGHKSSRSHTKHFYSILDDLAEKAEAAGIYKPAIDDELEKMIGEAQKISREIAKLQRELGAVLLELNNACVKKGVRFSDVMSRKARISNETANKTIKMQAMDLSENIEMDIQEALAGERDIEKRSAMAAAAKAGKSIYQTKCAGSSSSSKQSKGENEFDELLREKERLERTIENLNRRLREIMEKIKNDAGLQMPCAADRRSG